MPNCIEIGIQTFHDIALDELQRMDLMVEMRKYGSAPGLCGRGRVQIDLLAAALRHVYVWSMLRRLVTSNPAAKIPKESEYEPLDRWLKPDEIKRYWAACDQVGWPAGPIFKLLLLTG
jgi:integrase